MASNYDLSLNDIVSKNKISGRRSRGGRGAANQRRGSSGTGRGRGLRTRPRARSFVGIQSRPNRALHGAPNMAGRWSLNAYYGRPVALSTPNKPTKLNITNLDFGVSDADINELFSEFPMMRNASVHYDRNGRSLGTAHVIYERRAEALLAIKKYNGVHLDGRPMHVEIDGVGGGGDKISKVSVFNGNRVGPRNNVKRLQSQRNQIAGSKRTQRNRNTRGIGARGGKAKTEKKSGQKEKKKIPTAEELDAELEEYKSQKNK